MTKTLILPLGGSGGGSQGIQGIQGIQGLQCIHSENDSIVKAEALQRVISPFDERCHNCKKEDRQ